MGSSRYLLSALVAVSALVGLAFGKVVELTDSDFKSEMAKFDTALVMFYAPWCGHCKRMKPEFETASGDLEKNIYPVQLVKVDCTEAGKDTCSEFGVSGYPTLKVFRSGSLSSDYNGPRQAPGIVKHMKAQVGPASVELTDDATCEKLVGSSDGVLVIGVLEKPAEMEVFQKAASKLRETAQFAHSTKATTVCKAGIFLHRPAHLRTKLEPESVKFDGAATDVEAIDKFVKDNYHGLVGHRTVDNDREFGVGRDLLVAYYVVDYKKNPKGTNYWRNRVMKVAKAFAEKNKKAAEKLTFAVSNINDFGRELSDFGLEGEDGSKPVVAVKDAAGKKYVMKEEFSVDALTAFVEKFAAGKIEAYLKSEPVPEANDAPVKVAVGKNFDDLVTNSGKDALVEFYAPWCGHCKSLAPVYDQLGEKMTGEDVLIVKMDATANDAPSAYQVNGFPTIYWVKKGEKPESYNGGRELDEFVKFIAKKATNELNGYDREGKAKKTEL